ncbi:flagellar basal body rod modification protein FlgD [Legionella beliardensis]|uniref:Flagellar basal body rod modification protein FlgD n=1 Tax=Legionella beliardensis TaxID=91822 RepID=A0A378I1A0_9GAMM|nr:FLgD tudor-like domain-containing protein [Legionella beliardensis]STX28732.1 flagellar basal body rod modification protein FlgD [Legionella beliardensis]
MFDLDGYLENYDDLNQLDTQMRFPDQKSNSFLPSGDTTWALLTWYHLNYIVPDFSKCLASTFQSNQVLQASALVGRKVIVTANYLLINKELSCQMLIEVITHVNKAMAVIYDCTGRIIRKLLLGEQPAGFLEFEWDLLNYQGLRIPPGKYLLQASGFVADKKIPLKTLIIANVNGVNLEQKTGEIKLSIAGLGDVTLEQVEFISN